MTKRIHHISLLLLLSLLMLTGIGMPLHAQEQYKYHRVARGETVTSIAKEYGVSPTAIFKANPGCKTVLWAGATLRIPVAQEAPVIDMSELDETDPSLDTLYIEKKMLSFISTLGSIPADDAYSIPDIDACTKQINTLDVQWTTYYQARQDIIADHSGLMDLVATYQQIKQQATDTLAANRLHITNEANFRAAQRCLQSHVDDYKSMDSEAKKLSLVAATASKLEELKNKEQLIWAEVDKQYQTAKGIAEKDSSYMPQLEPLTQQYLDLKKQSEDIQEAKYVPFFDRIKEYLLGLAAVAIISMFVIMVQARIKSFKQAKENAKKMKEMFPNKGDDEHPTI